MVFRDRREAGRRLAQAVRDLPDLADAVVLGLPRGGVPVAFEVARELRVPLDIFIVRKLGVPGEEELAMGAVASGGMVVLNGPVIRTFAIRDEEIDAAIERERLEIERRDRQWRGRWAPIAVAGRRVILVDDGLATGSTMKAAARALRPIARRVTAAVPVAAAVTCGEIRGEIDDFVCLESPLFFSAVGEFYRNFDPTSDDEVRALLEQAHQDGNSPRAA